MKILIILPTLLFFVLTQKLVAQAPAKVRNEAVSLFNAKKYRQALALFRQFAGYKPDDFEVQNMMGISAYHANDLALAKKSLKIVLDNAKKVAPETFLFYGKTLHADLDFKTAVKFYKEYLRKSDLDEPNRHAIVADVKRCASGMRISNQSELAIVESLGENVNSLHDEFAPVTSPNDDEKIYFSAAREDSEGGVRNAEGLSDVKNGTFISDIYSTFFDAGDWTLPEQLNNSLINSPRHEILMDFTDKGKALFFFRGMTQYSGEILVDTFKTENELRGLPPQFQSPMRADLGDNSFVFFNDTLLIFASRQAGGLGGSDLYYSFFRNNEWSRPINMGEAINSSFDETTPYLARDGRTLYFSSNSLQSMGGFDIFKTTFDEDSLSFLDVTNVGKPLNSAGDDTHFRLTSDGLKGFFCSNRKDGLGERDIFFAIFKSLQPEQTPSVPTAFHLVRDAKANSPQVAAVSVTKITEYKITPIFYDNDDDVLRGGNLQQVKTVLEILKKYPALVATFTINCTEGDKTAFDLYLSTKRGEKIAKYLAENGVRNDQILLKSVGAAYPIARTFLDGNPNLPGEKMNRRVDIAIQNITNEPVKIMIDAPPVSPFMVDNTGDRLIRHTKGLSYKVQFMTSKRLTDSEIFVKYTDAMMEAKGTEGLYQYTIGLFNDFNAAENLRKDLFSKENIRDASVIPYVDGLRVIGDDAKKHTQRYFDLINYLNARKKP